MELPAQPAGLGIHIDAQVGAAQLRRERQRVGPGIVAPHRHHDVGGTPADCGRKHPALRHDDDEALETERETGGGNFAPEKHSDEIVVPPAAAQAAGQVGYCDLHDRTRVV